jgi:hypothetical protein
MGRRTDIKPLPTLERLQELLSYDEHSGVLMWRAVITTNGHQRRVGRYLDLKEAEAVMTAARAVDHGEFARTT